ncbi:hypothetical protein JS518_00470 [Clostridiales bacterium FE2010]|nr:hypothetical protein JS518_00470 [Clostridiales bacterium FE2010]
MKESTDIIKYPKYRKEKETFIVFNYLKEHHGLLLASISAIVTITSFIINMASFIRQNNYLRSWGITNNFYIYSSSQFVYLFVVMLIIDIFIPLLLWKLEVTFTSFFRDCSILIYTKYILKHYKKRQKRAEAILAKKRKDNTNDADPEMEKNLNELKGMIATSHNKIHHILSAHIVDVIILIIAFVILLLPLWTLLIIIAGQFSIHAMILWLVICFFIVTTSYMGALLNIHPCTPRKMKKILKISLKNRSSLDGFFDTIHNFFTELPERNKKYGFLSDAHLRRSTIAILASIIGMICTFTVFSSNESNTIWIYDDNESIYAVIYQRPDLLVMEQANIQNETITVFMDQIKYVQPNDCTLQKKEFKTVIKQNVFKQEKEDSDDHILQVDHDGASLS